MSATKALAAMEASQRNRLEGLLMEFDRSWRADLLWEFVVRLESETDRDWRDLALTELLKIDLQRGWAAGQGRLLEEYLARFPLMGAADQVRPELLLVEYEARRSIDPGLSLRSYAERFPRQFEELRRLAGQFVESAQPPQASVDTSRIANAWDTVAPRQSAAEAMSEEFGRYRIIRELGAGAMGTVYLAHDTKLDRQVALKTPKFKGAEESELVSRFYREARAIAALAHRNICPVYDVGEIDGRHYMAMAFIRGRRLKEFVTNGKFLPPRTAALLIQRLALAEAHRHNVIHRDLKPDNIMIDHKREPVVMDFGLARKTDGQTRMTQSGMLVGSPAYMSPEQVSGDHDEVGPAADVYALGVILYESLTGDIPFRGSIVQVLHQIMSESPRPPSQVRDGIDPRLEAICLKMMAKNRAERYQSMEDVAADLKAYLKGSAAEPSSATHTGPKPGVGGQGSRETDPLKAYFAAQAAADPLQTVLEPTVSGNIRPRGRRKSPTRRSGRWPRIASGLAVIGAIVFGVTFLLRTSHGTIKVELSDPTLSVVIDDDRLTVGELQGPIELSIGGHTIHVESRGETVTPGESLTIGPDEQAQRLVVKLGDVELRGPTFEIASKNEVVLTVELLDEPTIDAGRDPKTPRMLVAPFDAATAGRRQQAWAEYLGTEVVIENSIGMKLVQIPAGEFLMGATPAEVSQVVNFDPQFKREYADDEQPQHRVQITNPFFLGQFEVTVGEFRKFVTATNYQTEFERNGQGYWGWNESTGRFDDRNPKYHWRNTGFTQTDDHPVMNVSWNDAMAFCEWLSKQEGEQYRLPTEAEWEFACRAGTTGLWSHGDDPAGLARVGNVGDATAKDKWTNYSGWAYNEARDGAVFTARVGSYEPNAFGLCDMHGNVWEWCADWHDPAAYRGRTGVTRDPLVESGKRKSRVLRGASWQDSARNARSATRPGSALDDRHYYDGFRLARTITPR